MRGFQDQIIVMVRQKKTLLWVTFMIEPYFWEREGKEEGQSFLLAHLLAH